MRNFYGSNLGNNEIYKNPSQGIVIQNLRKGKGEVQSCWSVKEGKYTSLRLF